MKRLVRYVKNNIKRKSKPQEQPEFPGPQSSSHLRLPSHLSFRSSVPPTPRATPGNPSGNPSMHTAVLPISQIITCITREPGNGSEQRQSQQLCFRSIAGSTAQLLPESRADETMVTVNTSRQHLYQRGIIICNQEVIKTADLGLSSIPILNDLYLQDCCPCARFKCADLESSLL